MSAAPLTPSRNVVPFVAKQPRVVLRDRLHVPHPGTYDLVVTEDNEGNLQTLLRPRIDASPWAQGLA